MSFQKLVIKKDHSELKKVEYFVEKISDQFNINHTYYSNILISLLELSKLAISSYNKSENDEILVITFVNKDGKFIFEIEGIASSLFSLKGEKEKLADFDKTFGNIFKIVKSLADNVFFDHTTDRICVEFHVDKVNEFLSKMRRKELTKYRHDIYKITNASEEKD